MAEEPYTPTTEDKALLGLLLGPAIGDTLDDATRGSLLAYFEGDVVATAKFAAQQYDATQALKVKVGDIEKEKDQGAATRFAAALSAARPATAATEYGDGFGFLTPNMRP